MVCWCNNMRVLSIYLEPDDTHGDHVREAFFPLERRSDDPVGF